MTRPYTQEDYEALAYAVLAGMPESEAERILEDERKHGARGEELYWLTLQKETKYATTTIQITVGTKEVLRELKLAKKESWEDVIKRVIAENEEMRMRIQEAEKVPEHEKENSELRAVNKKLEERVKELEAENKRLKGDKS